MEGKKKALIVAISEYKLGSGFQNLEFCKNNGEEMYSTLINLGYEIPDNKKIVGKSDQKTIQNAMIDFFEESAVQPSDTLLFYFTGHGVLDGHKGRFFGNSEITQESPKKDGVRFGLLNELLSSSIARKKIAILDCCFSGAAMANVVGMSGGDEEKEAEMAGRGELEKEFDKRFLGEGTCILASSLSNRRSYALKDEKFSAFSGLILKGLTGTQGSVDKDGFVTPHLLSEYVATEIRKIPELKNQKPVTNFSVTGPFIIAEHKELAKKTSESFEEKITNWLNDENIEDFNKFRKENQYKEIILENNTLSNKNLLGLDLRFSNIRQMGFSECNLREAVFHASTLFNVKFFKSVLNNAVLSRVTFSGCSFTNTSLMDAQIKNSNFSGCSFLFADFTNADFSNSILTGANFSNIYMKDVNFIGANLTGASFKHTMLQNAKFTDANLTGADFTDADLTDADLTGANLTGAKTDGVKPKSLSEELEQQRENNQGENSIQSNPDYVKKAKKCLEILEKSSKKWRSDVMLMRDSGLTKTEFDYFVNNTPEVIKSRIPDKHKNNLFTHRNKL